MEINVRSHTPIYLQLAQGLREMIRAGELPQGHEFPGEFAMAKQYGVGREAVRKALAVLRQEGIVATKKGEASYVRVQPERNELPVGRRTRVWFRQTTPEERIEMGLDEGVGLAVVEVEGEEPRLIPSDEVVIVGE
ncbi:GntR family transcriptional regulator [Acrocarpospora phusangensis]|uniref:GntR family transcriptional regulator n=1 Tax=Acrocarpospora phusangensis TaxID=1070424 RepID=UPI001951C96E|nr:GntR family transcriptional regulator [Acrocarpospora phusangensis]